MKITRNIISEVPLRDIKRGEPFLYNNEVLMKISYATGGASYSICVFLDNGITQDFSPDIMVMPVDVEIIVSYSENRRKNNE